MWWIWTSSKIWIRDQQSKITVLQEWEMPVIRPCVIIMLTIYLPSISMSSLRMLRSYARATSLQRPQSSTTMKWIRLEKPAIQLSMQTLISPPTLALPKFPQAKPLVLSLKIPRGRGFQPMKNVVLIGFPCFKRQWEVKQCSKGRPPMIFLLWVDQISQATIGKATFQLKSRWHVVLDVEVTTSSPNLLEIDCGNPMGVVGWPILSK